MKNFDFFEVKGYGGWVNGFSEYDLFQIFIKMERRLSGLNGFTPISLFASENGLKRISWLVDGFLAESKQFLTFRLPFTDYPSPFSNVKFSPNVTKLLLKSFFNVKFYINLFGNC